MHVHVPAASAQCQGALCPAESGAPPSCPACGVPAACPLALFPPLPPITLSLLSPRRLQALLPYQMPIKGKASALKHPQPCLGVLGTQREDAMVHAS